LIRHGQTENNKNKVYCGWTDSELDRIGILQAEKISAYLKDEKIDAIYSSPMKRAVDTANAIALKQKDAKFYFEDSIREVNFGVFEGLTYNDIYENYGDEAKKWTEQGLKYCFPKGEDIQKFHKRVSDFYEKLIKVDYNKVAIVTHEGCIRCLLSYITIGSIDMFWKYSVKVGSISRVDVNQNYSYVLSLNENHMELIP